MVFDIVITEQSNKKFINNNEMIDGKAFVDFFYAKPLIN